MRGDVSILQATLPPGKALHPTLWHNQTSFTQTSRTQTSATMHISFSSVISLATLAAAGTIQVNYFYDGSCHDYVLSVHPFTNGKCYDYQYSGTSSAGITNCDGFDKSYNCYCQLYTAGGCTGASQIVDYKNENNRCARNTGHGSESMQCWAYL